MSRAVAGAVATRRCDSSSGYGSGTTGLVPEVLEVVEGEPIAELVEVVLDVDDQHLVRTTVQSSSEPAPDHLLVHVRAESGSGDVDGTHGGCIESLRENGVVRDDPGLPAAETLDVVPPLGR